MANMDDFESENPFTADIDVASPNLRAPMSPTADETNTLHSSETSSSNVNVSAPTSPPFHPVSVNMDDEDEDAFAGGFGGGGILGGGGAAAAAAAVMTPVDLGGDGDVDVDDADVDPDADADANVVDGRQRRDVGGTVASPGSGSTRAQQRQKTEFCCSKDRWLHSSEDVEILIIDAQKTSLNSSSPYITYVIKCGSTHSSHRYSEFESLRSSLAKLHPTLIVPPIPSKQPLSDYAVKQAKAKEDAGMIARRKRMLQTFLNRIAKHAVLSNDHVFHRFLEGEVSWTEVLHSPPLSLLPKSVLKAPPQDPTNQDATLTYAALPTPSPSHPLRHPDQRFQDSEAFTSKFASHMAGPMEKVTRRTLRRWTDIVQDNAELGAALNGFSLSENGELSAAIEKTGQAIDATYISTSKLTQELEQNWMEPVNEYAQFAAIIKKLLQYRHQKHVQYEMTQDALEHKRVQLEELEKSEREAQRLADALGRGRNGAVGPGLSQSETVGGGGGGGGEGQGQQEGESGEDADGDGVSTVGSGSAIYGQSQSTPAYIPSHPGPSPVRRRVPGAGLLNALSYTIHGMMDADPETARRNGITRNRDQILQLEEALKLSGQDLKFSSVTIQSDLDRFQRQKVADLRDMCINMARSHRDWCKKNLEAWEEAKRAIDEIPEHPNRPPPEEQEDPAATSPTAPEPFAHVKTATAPARRDSNATVNGR